MQDVLRLAADKNVFNRVQVGEGDRLLVDHGDAGSAGIGNAPGLELVDMTQREEPDILGERPGAYLVSGSYHTDWTERTCGCQPDYQLVWNFKIRAYPEIQPGARFRGDTGKS